MRVELKLKMSLSEDVYGRGDAVDMVVDVVLVLETLHFSILTYIPNEMKYIEFRVLYLVSSLVVCLAVVPRERYCNAGFTPSIIDNSMMIL